jgi:hypothetical protein
MKNITAPISAGLLALIFAGAIQPSPARGGRWTGPNGGVGAHAGSYTGANGVTLTGARGGFATRNAGLFGGAFSARGANGGTASGSGAAGYKRGLGAFEGTNMTAVGPKGSTYNGYTRGAYNAQTGQGSYNASHQAYDAQNGKSYGDTNQTSYTKGQGGVTQLDTDNHGDYSIDWAKGQKPVVTQD